MQASQKLIQAVAVTAEVCGRVFTPGAAQFFVESLSGYPEAAVLTALQRCAREVRGVLTLADVISRIDDGRPTADEAWAGAPRDEATTVVWTEDARQAHSVAKPLIDIGDMVGARKAFIDSYNYIIANERAMGNPVRWVVSLGHDFAGRESALMRGVEQGRVALAHAKALCPRLMEKDDPTPALPGPKHLGSLISPVIGSLARKADDPNIAPYIRQLEDFLGGQPKQEGNGV